jgi:hypothetical protein
MGRHTAFAYCLFLTSGFAADYTIVDIQSVPVSGDPASAVIRVTIPDLVPEVDCDVLVAGAGMGGIGAARRGASRPHGLPYRRDRLDRRSGNRGWSFRARRESLHRDCRRHREYYRFRSGIRAASGGLSNPGNCYVSALCFEPRIGVDVLEAMIAHQSIQVFRRTQIVALERAGTQFTSAVAWQFDKRAAVRFRFRWVLDGTEMGDLLPLGKLPYVAGSGRSPIPASRTRRNPTQLRQSFTYPSRSERWLAIIRPGESRHRPPPDYDAIRRRQDFTLRMNYPVENGWKGIVEYSMFGEDPPIPNNMSPRPFFRWRRLSVKPTEIALMNWPRQDYAAESILDREPRDLARVLQIAKRTSLAFLYWLQHDLGHPELKLRSDVMDTADGFSKYPYVRESRRLLTRGRVVEQDIVDEYQPGPRARSFDDAIGTGFYMVDIHPCGSGERGRMMMPRPFQIPMAALLPRENINFLPAGKNIGVTHLTNGAFRLHPSNGWWVKPGNHRGAGDRSWHGAAGIGRPGGPCPCRSPAGLVRRPAGRSPRFRGDPVDGRSRPVPAGR